MVFFRAITFKRKFYGAISVIWNDGMSWETIVKPGLVYTS